MSLVGANWCPQATVMLHNGQVIPMEKQAELKSIFLEGLIRFLDIYVQTEIGEGIQIDIMKVALHINSPSFENDDLYLIKSIDDAYDLLEQLVIAGLPIWRFLRLSDYQSQLFESGYSELCVTAKMKAADERPCYGCIWYEETDTFLGPLKRCNKPRTEWMSRTGPHEPEKILECKWLTTLDSIPEEIYSDGISDITRNNFLKSIDRARERFKEKLLDDPFRIPKELSEDEVIDLDKQYDVWEDFADAWNNKRTKTERQNELRKAMYTEGMIRFFENYAKCELGSRYIADIKNISLYVFGLEDNEIQYIKTFDDVYLDLENKIIKGFNVKKFVKFDEES